MGKVLRVTETHLKNFPGHLDHRRQRRATDLKCLLTLSTDCGQGNINTDVLFCEEIFDLFRDVTKKSNWERFVSLLEALSSTVLVSLDIR